MQYAAINANLMENEQGVTKSASPKKDKISFSFRAKDVANPEPERSFFQESKGKDRSLLKGLDKPSRNFAQVDS